MLNVVWVLLTGFCCVLFKDVMMLGAVGAYAWSGTVVHQKGSKVDILPLSAFEGTLQDRNHSSLLGMHLTDVIRIYLIATSNMHETKQEW